MTTGADGSATSASPLILGDWGTTCLRLHLCDVGRSGRPEVRGSVEGPGAKYVSDFPAVLLDAASRLPPHPQHTEVVLAGMVGSSIGWREASYVPCPASWLDIAGNAVSLSAGTYRVTILPGASCANRFGYHDVMRGEETQLVGAMQTQGRQESRMLVGLPGTHTKWATVDTTGLQSFATTMPGELFEILRKHSILAPAEAEPGAEPRPLSAAAFDSAVELLRLNEDLGIIQALFSTRSRMLAGELAAVDASSYLSGLLIGADIRDVCMPLHHEHAPDRAVILVGDKSLTNLYARAMARYGIDSCQYSGDDCSVRGLAACYKMHRGQLEA